MNSDNELREQRTLEDDTVRLAESVEDLALGAEYNKHLRKIRSRWRAAALASILVFLMIILYGCGSTKHSDTIVPNASQESEPVETTVPPADGESEIIEVYEYVIKANGISPDFTEDLIVPSDDPHRVMEDNMEAMEAYADTYTIDWILEKGDDSFTAERKAGEKVFKSEKPYEFTNNYTIYKITDGSVNYPGKNIHQACISLTPDERAEYEGGVTSIAVILPESFSEGDISSGVSAFLEEFKALDWRQKDNLDADIWNVLDRSRDDMVQMLGDSFGVQGYVISPDQATGDIHFLDEDGKTVVESEYLEDGDKVVFISLERFYMGKGYVPAYYSKYLQGDSKFLKVFDSREEIVNFLEESNN